MVSQDLQKMIMVALASVGVGGTAWKLGSQAPEVAGSLSVGMFFLFFALDQYRKQQQPTGFAAQQQKQVAASNDNDDDDVEEEEESVAKVPKSNKNSKRLARKAKAKAERKKNGPSEAELKRERERAAKEKADKLAREKAKQPESQDDKKKKKKAKAVARKKNLEMMNKHQAEVDAGEWEVMATSRPVKAQRDDDDDDDSAKPKVVAEATVYEEVDPKFYGRIIGTAGATLNALQDGTATEITVPRRDANHRMVTIVGTHAGTKLAQQYIKDLVSKGYCKLTDPDMTSTTVKVPGKQHMSIVGPGGSTIRTLQQKTNTRINIPNKDSKSEDIDVLGAAADVAMAVSAIKELVSDGFSSITHEGWIKYPVQVDPIHFRTIIGKGGSTIKSIQTTSGCKVNIPNAAAADQKVYICGPLNGVDHAEQLMRKAIAEAEKAELEYQQSQIIELDTTGVWAERNYHESDLWN